MARCAGVRLISKHGLPADGVAVGRGAYGNLIIGGPCRPPRQGFCATQPYDGILHGEVADAFLASDHGEPLERPQELLRRDDLCRTGREFFSDPERRPLCRRSRRSSTTTTLRSKPVGGALGPERGTALPARTIRYRRSVIACGTSAVVFAILLLAGVPAAAQPEGERIRARVKGGQEVRVTDEQGREFRGRIATVSGDGLRIVSANAAADLLYGEIVRIGRPRDTLSNGALIGFAAMLSEDTGRATLVCSSTAQTRAPPGTSS